MSNQNAFTRFMELLESGQAKSKEERDIREYVLFCRDKKVGFGYISETLKNKFGANLPNIFDYPVGVDQPEIGSADLYVAFGTIFSRPDHSHKGGVRLLNIAPADKEVLFCEAGFLATSHSWAHSFKEGNPAYACLGFVYDDISHYFMADYPNRIIQKLNSEEAPTDPELDRAEVLLTRIVSQRISKYNAQPMRAPTMTEGYSRRVLVCDQTFADASTIYGKVDETDFEKMLLAAISENPDAEVLVKTHPDSVWEKTKRSGYFSHLQSTGRVRMLREPMNPYALFEHVDTVYVGTSQMGLEALFAGKKVVTFGAPFYAGWGLTDDRQSVPHRHRERTLLEIFHYFYIWYTIYALPGKRGVAEIEDVLTYIEQTRPYSLPVTAAQIAETPKVSVIIPVHGVEKYIEECIASVQEQSLKEIEIIPINDVSPDGAQEIIDRLAETDPRIRPIVLKENVKQGMARNIGMKQARGTYVWLLDGDDWLSNKDMLANLYEQAQADNVDMLRCRKAYEAIFDAEDVFLRRRADETEKHFSGVVHDTNFAQTPALLFNRHCWTWLYRREFLVENDIQFFTPQWEERAFLMRALVKAKTIGMSETDGPVYRVRMDSTARRQRGTRDFEMMLTNFHHTFESFLEEGAEQRDNPLRFHLEFQLSQFVHHILMQQPYKTYRDLGEEAERGFVAKIRREFERCDFRPDDFVIDRRILRPEPVAASAYQLVVAAVLNDRLDLLRAAVDLAPVDQSLLYETLLQEPLTQAGADIQSALSCYARNTRVKIGPRDTEPYVGPKPRIVVHIGSTKTGSTYLQHLMDKNRPALLRDGVWVPEVGLFWQPTRPRKQAGHSEFPKAAVNKNFYLLDYIARGLSLLGGKVHTIVLSSEAYFLSENAQFLGEYFADYPMEMVVYLRRQDEWANSQYCEFVAGGAVGRVDVPIEKWLEDPVTRRRLDYRNPLNRWSEKIGAENVSVRIFDRSEFIDGDLLSDFAATTKLPELLSLPKPDPNERNDARLTNGHVELIRLFNKRDFARRNDYFDFVEEVGDALSTWRADQGLPQPKPWMLSEEQADALMAEYADANAEIAERYLKRSDQPLFGPRGAIPEQAGVFPAEMALVEKIYERHAPPVAEKSASKKPAQKLAKKQPAQKPAKKQPKIPLPTVVTYGLFGWRLWLLTPILAMFLLRSTAPDQLRKFITEPAAYARLHWSKTRPLLVALLYPEGNSMGPGGIFKLWIPVARRLIGGAGREDMLKNFDEDPILFVRSMRSPLRRFVARLMFPVGEVRFLR